MPEDALIYAWAGPVQDGNLLSAAHHGLVAGVQGRRPCWAGARYPAPTHTSYTATLPMALHTQGTLSLLQTVQRTRLSLDQKGLTIGCKQGLHWLRNVSIWQHLRCTAHWGASQEPRLTAFSANQPGLHRGCAELHQS